ncbi:MAG TPA: hypothetical protein VJ550_07275 [Geomonas sp.]|nr:hypothetical protein [Geomonas sp.]
MKKLTSMALLFQLFLFQAHPLHADDYSDCKSQCARDYADCMNQPRASEPEEQTAKEAACTQKQETCNGDCERYKQVNEDLGPETAPDRR